ncbi:epoxyqueuosine reductase [Bacilli bacterium PM5-3]|nr:epoxyqueuosine reductase [Bacilli bacterium PM5-3]MDH6603264.1 epoxyqueuosine reductase [Bacilli bacterium PM5-9]
MSNYNMIVSFINDLDFDIVGFTTIKDNTEYIKRVTSKYNQGMLYPRNKMDYHDYVALDKLIDNPKTIISVGISYHQIQEMECEKLFGKYSKISFGIDYHKIIYEKLKKIEAFLKDNYSEVQCYLSCDNKVVDDRYFAYLCGNGFYGKNTMIINQEFGSEVFYGTLITNIDIDFEAKEILESQCGSCSICENNCPTKSLNNYSLNYKSCLSHLTQSKALIKPSIINNRIFGCDECNDCCPYNSKVKQSNAYQMENNCLELIDLIKMSNKEYNETFKEKGFYWLNKNILKKNAVLCLGNYLDEYQMEITQLAKQVKSPLLIEAFDYILKMEE